MKMVKMPELEEIKTMIENRYKVKLFGRTVNGDNVLTQWSPMYIEIRWHETTAEGHETYWLTIAQNDHSKPIYATGYMVRESIDSVIGRLEGFCKKRTFKQESLW